MEKKILKVGDEVIWRGCWGMEDPKIAKVTGIEKTKGSHQKYGNKVEFVEWINNFVVTLDNNHWAYDYQLWPVEE